METSSKVVPQIVVSVLLIIGGIFLFRFETSPYHDEIDCTFQPCQHNEWFAEFGYRPYGVAILLLGVAYLAFIAYKATRKTANEASV